jgi:Sec-independent protein translocase protein TatA
VLGPKRLPALARALGQGIREFRASLDSGAEATEGSAAATEGSAERTEGSAEPAEGSAEPAEGSAEPAPQPVQPTPLHGPTAPAPLSPDVGQRESAESSAPERPRESA